MSVLPSWKCTSRSFRCLWTRVSALKTMMSLSSAWMLIWFHSQYSLTKFTFIACSVLYLCSDFSNLKKKKLIKDCFKNKNKIPAWEGHRGGEIFAVYLTRVDSHRDSVVYKLCDKWFNSSKVYIIKKYAHLANLVKCVSRVYLTSFAVYLMNWVEWLLEQVPVVP